MFPYNKIFKQAWELTKQNKFLWLFGLFLVISYTPGYFDEELSSMNKPENLIAVGILILVLVLAIIYFQMKAGLIISIKALIDKQPTSFPIGLKAAKFFYWRIIGSNLILQLCLAIIFSLVLSFAVPSRGSEAVVMWAFAGLILIPLTIVTSLLRVLSPMFITLFDLKIRESFDRSYELISKFLPQILMLGFVLLVIEGVPLFLSVFMVGLVGNWVYKIPVILGVYAVLAPITVFIQSTWVLAFLELVRPQKMEEEEVVAPEIIT